MPLRKVNIFTSALGDNSASFVNVTGDIFDLLRLDLTTVSESTAGTEGDAATCSIDEVPAAQVSVNDSRSHIMHIDGVVQAGTGGVEVNPQSKILAFNRGDLLLRPDEAIFMNTIDVSGALDVGFSLNVWYDD